MNPRPKWFIVAEELLPNPQNLRFTVPFVGKFDRGAKLVMVKAMAGDHR